MARTICRKPIAWTRACSPLVALALAATFIFGSVAPGFAKDRNDTVVVMTRNLYFGTNFDALLAAGSFLDLVTKAGEAIEDIRASEPNRRAAAVAREIVRNRVDLVGIQEGTIVRTGPLSLPPPPVDPTFPLPETAVESDGLQLLLNELRRLGEPYEVVAVVPGLDAQLPTGLGIDGRLTLRSAIIARSRGSLELSNVQVQGYLRNGSFSAAGVALPNPRGWASVDVEKNGRKFRFVTTHLEEPHLLEPFGNRIQTLQAIDMIAGGGNTNLPVVFVGDFNVVPPHASDPTYTKFTAAGFVDAWTRKRPFDAGFTCCQNPDLQNTNSVLNRRIDLVYYRGAFVVEDIHLVGERPRDRIPPGLWPSDHAGVVATLRIPRGRHKIGATAALGGLR